MRLISFGDAVADLVLRVPALPARGGDVLAGPALARPGGSGLLALVAAAEAGLPGVLCGPTGTGPNGDLVRGALDRAGVLRLGDPVAAADTGIAVTLVEPDGERTFVTSRGAEAGVPPFERLRVEPDDLVHLPGYALVEPARAAATVAALDALPGSVTVLVDPGPLWAGIDPAIRVAAEARADWWSGSAGEPRAAGRRGSVLRLGARGCAVRVAGGERRLLPAEPVTGDTNGAGDVHVGAFLAALAAGADPFEAAARANAAAARRIGCLTGRAGRAGSTPAG